MIVSPDFLDEWKMTELQESLDRDPAAPVYVLRLWAHCQLKKAWEFEDIPALSLRSICKAPHDSRKFFDAMVSASYVVPKGAGFAVPGWAELNAQLIAAWTNGRNGGRPSKPKPEKPNGKPSGIPTPPPTETHGQPDGEPIREDKTGDNPRASDDALPPFPPAPPPRPQKKPVEPAKTPAAPTPPAPTPGPAVAPAAPLDGRKPKGVDLFGDDEAKQPGRKGAKESADPSKFPCPEGVTPQVWGEWLAYRLELSTKNNKAPFTTTAMRGVVSVYLKRCMEVGESGDDALLRAMAQGWRAPFVDPDLQRQWQRKNVSLSGMGRRMSQRDVDAERGMQLAGESPIQQPRGERDETRSGRAGDVEDVAWRDHPGPDGQ